MTKYITNFCKDYCNHWTASHAIAELVGNYLDSDGEQEFEFTEDSITLTNQGIIVSNKMLISGMSDKRGNDAKRGTFGIGSLQALVVLTGLDINVSMWNGGIIWVPRFEHCDNFDAEIMVIDELPHYKSNNFSVHISGLDEEIISEVKQRCTIFQDRQVLYSTDIGDIINTLENDESEIFVGDMFVTQSSDFKYSYNFKPSVVPLTQDRNCMDAWELKKLTAKLISLIEDEAFVKEAIEANTYDTQLVTDHYYIDKGYGTDSHAAVEVFGEDFVKEHEGKVVTASYSEHQTNEELGNPSVYIDNDVKVKSIQQSSAYEASILGVELKEKPTPCEVVGNLKEHLECYLDDKLECEELTEVENMLESILELSNSWSGDSCDSLPF